MKKNRYMFMLSPDTGAEGGVGSSVFDEPEVETIETPEAPTEPTPEVEPKPTESGGIDYEKLAETMGSAIAKAVPQKPTEEPEKPLSEAEVKKMLKVWEPNDEFLEKFGNVETQKEAFELMRDAMLQQFATVMQIQMQQRFEQLNGTLAPVLTAHEQMVAQQRESRFNEKYSPLAKPEFKPILQAVAATLEKQGKQFKTEDEAFDALASEVEKVIQVSNPQFKLSEAGAKAPATPKIPAVTGLPVTTAGSGAGGGASTDATATSKKRGIAVFE